MLTEKSNAGKTVTETIGKLQHIKRINMLGCTEIGKKYLNAVNKPTKDELLDQRLNIQIQRKEKKLNDVFYQMEIEAIDTILDLYNEK